MKKILLFLMIASLLASCYDESRLDFEYTTVAFSSADGGSNQEGVLYRTVVKDEGLELEYGCYVAGILDNKKERWADFIIDASLLGGTPYQLMPSNYYTLSNSSRFVIPPGTMIGTVTITLDSANFVNDLLSVQHTYAIPFRITATSEDYIHATQNTKILVISYMNHYEGFYVHEGSFTTKDAGGGTLNTGEIDNVLTVTTVMLDTVKTNGMMNLIGSDNVMKIGIGSDNSVSLEYVPNPDVITIPYNLATDATPQTSYVSPWENLDAINDGYEPANSMDKGPGAYGNWPNAETWNWVEYNLPSTFGITQSDVYWWTDGGGIQIPYDTYVEYWNITTQAWETVPNVVGNGVAADQWNITTFDRVVTDKIRLHFIATESQGILEWKIWGLPVAATLEQAVIDNVTPNGSNTFDPSTNTITLDYTVNYKFETYTTDVSATMTWRNRVRDGIHEWRR